MASFSRGPQMPRSWDLGGLTVRRREHVIEGGLAGCQQWPCSSPFLVSHMLARPGSVWEVGHRGE